MKNKFLSRDYSQKLNGTFIRYKGLCYYAVVTEEGQISLRMPQHYSSAKGAFFVSPTDDDLDISSIPLGYFNYAPNACAIYVKRLPLRNTKQGVSVNNITASMCLESSLSHVTSSTVLTASFADAVNDKFPTLSSAREMVSTTWHSVAISRDISLSRRSPDICNVFYKEDNIGAYKLSDSTLEITNWTFGYLLSKLVSNFEWRIL